MTLEQWVRDGKYEAFRRALAEVPASDPEITEALAAAVQCGDPRFVLLLLQHGADPDRRPADGVPILFDAVEQGAVGILHFLIAHHVDLDLPDADGTTALHYAIVMEGEAAARAKRMPEAEVTRTLLEHGANPALRNSQGRTPLDLARAYRHEAAVQLLNQYLVNPQ